MEAYLPLIIQLVSGAFGGNIAGKLLKNMSLGTIGNSIVGILGGGIGGWLLDVLGMGGGAEMAGAVSSMDLSSIIGSIAGGGVGGGVLMAIIGILKKAISK
ncbi:hypothetical protein [Poritiphilus flavus]|uniref:DNA methyltransferase n=1 Tax=Poritiphilus flavus TaxID=2697053 RepID=A0A6L9E8C7_9FLAO|nr:hypothetical protein [Poritiphilus flavus]NAS10894.1 hypothetical protein [Poritiphilus flavus]